MISYSILNHNISCNVHFIPDVQRLVLAPIERMMNMVDEVSRNPLQKLHFDRDVHSGGTCSLYSIVRSTYTNLIKKNVIFHYKISVNHSLYSILCFYTLLSIIQTPYLSLFLALLFVLLCMYRRIWNETSRKFFRKDFFSAACGLRWSRGRDRTV